MGLENFFQTKPVIGSVMKANTQAPRWRGPRKEAYYYAVEDHDRKDPDGDPGIKEVKKPSNHDASWRMLC